MSKPLFAASFLAASLLAAPAMSEDFDWTGAYIGAQAGYAWGESNTDLPGFPLAGAESEPEGALGGLYAGYNWSAGNVVFGLEADVAAADLNGTANNSNSAGVITDDTFETDSEWTAALRGRIGFAFGGVLPYIAGGLAVADIESTFQDGSGGLPSSDSSIYAGWTIGAGVDVAFSPNLIGRVEYRYSDYGEEDFGLTGVVPTETDMTTHDVRLGLAYKF